MRSHLIIIILLPVCLACTPKPQTRDKSAAEKDSSRIAGDTNSREHREIHAFFNDYEKRFNDAIHNEQTDVEAAAAVFSDCFVEASPAGVICGKNDDAFRTIIRGGYRFYKSIGVQYMKILHKDISLLDPFHSMTKVRWQSGLVKKDGSKLSIDFNVIYFLQKRDGGLKIFSYIAEDEQKAYRENGIEPYR